MRIDSDYVYLVGYYYDSNQKYPPLIYRQPIGNLNGGGHRYVVNGLDNYNRTVFSNLTINSGYIYACGSALKYEDDNLNITGIVYKQPIKEINAKYANIFLQQDSTLSITNFGNDIVKESIELLITYIQS